MTLGNKIRSRREELRLTQPELAEKPMQRRVLSLVRSVTFSKQ